MNLHDGEAKGEMVPKASGDKRFGKFSEGLRLAWEKVSLGLRRKFAGRSRSKEKKRGGKIAHATLSRQQEQKPATRKFSSQLRKPGSISHQQSKEKMIFPEKK